MLLCVHVVFIPWWIFLPNKKLFSLKIQLKYCLLYTIFSWHPKLELFFLYMEAQQYLDFS